jgi:hypothetical protein
MHKSAKLLLKIEKRKEIGIEIDIHPLTKK